MRKFLLIVALVLTIVLQAQPPSRFYTKFGGNGDDIGYSGKPILDGQYIVAGSTTSYGSNGFSDVYLVKVDTFGLVVWQKFIGGYGNEVGKSVIQLPDSGFVIAGFTNSFGAGGYDAYLVRTDKNGNLIWQKTFGGPDWDFANDLVLAADGNIVVVGYTNSFGSGNKDGFILKYDLLGNLIWQKFVGGPENEELRSIINTNDSLLATVGYTESKGDINGDGYFLKLDLNGDTIFTRTYGGPYKDFASDLIQKIDGNYVVCGAKTYSGEKSKSHYYLLDLNGGHVADSTYYASSGDENFVSITNTTQYPDLFLVLRNVPVPNLGMQGNVLVLHYAGWPLLVNSFGDIGEEEFFSIDRTRDGGSVSIGSTTSFGSLGSDIFLMKHDSTLWNYTSVVGIEEKSKIEKPLIYYIDNHLIQMQFQENKIPGSVELLDLSGRVVKKIYVDSAEINVNLSDINQSIIIVKFIFKEGNIYYSKVINK